MSQHLNSTPLASRIHIGIYGRSNVGKSSLINALTNQELSIVSDIAGTTTDPVAKAMELLPLGPIVFIDTAGIDDEGMIGRERVARTMKTLDKISLALLVLDGCKPPDEAEKALIAQFEKRQIAYLIVRNKMDRYHPTNMEQDNEIGVSARTGENIDRLRQRVAAMTPLEEPSTPIISDLLSPGDLVILVTPIDSSAPKGRLILPQQQTIRDILDKDAQAIVTKEDGLADTLAKLAVKPRMVVTDSQVFKKVAAIIPPDLPLTSFSMLMARHKGTFRQMIAGVDVIDKLNNGDKVLISEGCTHRRQCEDIGSVKLPRWLLEYTGRQLDFGFTSGNTFPDDLTGCRLIIHCGACTLPPRAMQARMKAAGNKQIPITNYGMAIAKLQGILPRSLEPFHDWLANQPL